jgi:hypothetical protein
MDGHVEGLTGVQGNLPGHWPQSAIDLANQKKIGYLTHNSWGDDLQGAAYRPE